MTDALAGALDGVRVVALVTNVPGPLAAAALHAMGASVLKIEPIHGDALETPAPRWYREIVAGIEVVRWDLREEPARQALRDALRDADLLLTTMRAAALERLGLGWPSLHARYPRLVHVAIVGEASPHDDRAGHDLTYQARAGLLSPPAMPRTVVADLAAAERAVSSALAALLARERGSQGMRVEVAIVDAARAFAAPLRHGLTAPGGPLGGGLDTYRLYRASDGWIAVAALETHFIARLQELLDLERLDEASLSRAFAQRSAAHWQALADELDVPLAAIPAESGGAP
ncbi:MAG TPA: CoA transferase [Verrucomicrobiae bacterium]|nr:CoA transferase [Verrucomicrobiae bacterium]